MGSNPFLFVLSGGRCYTGNMKNGKFKIIIIQGPPGSGKGTQAKLIAEKLGYYHFISSQEGKKYMKTHNDPETIKQKENYDKGLLFDPDWIFEVVKEKSKEIFEEKSGSGGIVYDGSPRTLYEAKRLYELWDELIGKENIKAVKINVNENKLKERARNRLVCDKSGYHVFARSEKLQPGSPCPNGDGILRERDLDKEEIFYTRMDEYKNRTLPGLDFLKEKSAIIEINGEQSVEKVNKEILEALEIN